MRRKTLQERDSKLESLDIMGMANDEPGFQLPENIVFWTNGDIKESVNKHSSSAKAAYEKLSPELKEMLAFKE